MTDLFCKTSHLWGNAVLVNGHTYPISKEGVARVDDETDAEKLLTMKVWCRRDDPTSPRARVPASQRGAILEDGTLVPTQDADDDGDADGELSEEDNAVLAGKNPETGEYPDPDPKMLKKQLQALARVYQVEFGPQDTKDELVELIHKAMYQS